MYILSGAVAFAKTKIPNEEILARGLSLGTSLVASRCSSLHSSEYFTLEGTERFSAELNSTPTALGAEAITAACDALGITVAEIGLLIADSSTPRQTIPAESQRIAGSLGLKIPTFDILAPVIAPMLHLNLLSRWKKDQLPKYIALLYSNTPTVEGSVTTNPNRFDFGDGAAALIVSNEVSRGLFVEQTEIKQSASSKGIFSVYGEAGTENIFDIDESLFKNEVAAVPGTQICCASPVQFLQQFAEQASGQPILTGGVSQSGFALSTSTAATIVEAISLGLNFKVIANCGQSIATATLRRA